MARAEGAVRWYGRLAARYLVAIGLCYLVLVALLAGLTAHGLADSFYRGLALPAFCAVFPVLLAAAAPLRFSPHLAHWVGVALVLPLLPLLPVFGPLPLPLVVLHLAFARWFVPRPALLLR
ncbi:MULTISPECIES: hypothetical protein [Kitasatospora]|uniref:hypothetical protein n=1 Tax=Kitasatospora TaxID=2063 RepID=UPI000307F6D2|nr:MULTISPECIES: hypothetical protein [Kitasatospora]